MTDAHPGDKVVIGNSPVMTVCDVMRLGADIQVTCQWFEGVEHHYITVPVGMLTEVK
jgi:uncharacterized protein YodC (DUF2158 family)